MALLRRYCGAIEGTGLSLVDHLDSVEDAVVKHAVANMKQATLLHYFQPKQQTLCLKIQVSIYCTMIHSLINLYKFMTHLLHDFIHQIQAISNYFVITTLLEQKFDCK